MLLEWWHDFRFGLRLLYRSPVFALVAIVTLAVGIGANTAIFSLVNAVLLRPLPFADAGALTMVWESLPELGADKISFSAPDLRDFKERQRSFKSIATFQNKHVEFSISGAAERIVAARASASLLPLLGVSPSRGRWFTKQEDESGTRLVVLSHGLWRRRLNGDPGILGRAVSIDRVPYTVVGVMPRGFRFPPPGPPFNNMPAELWLPMSFTQSELESRGDMYNHSVIGRLRKGVTLERARAEARSLATQIQQEYPAELNQAFGGARLRLEVVPLRDELVGPSRALLLILMAAVGMVLLIACANIANLLLARTTGRGREMALRVAFGAGRKRLFRQMLLEALSLALPGGALGLVVAHFAVVAFSRLIPSQFAMPEEIQLDGTVLLMTLLLSLGSAVLFGVAPGLQVSRREIQSELNEGGRTVTASRGLRAVQNTFVVSQFALALLLLVAAGLLVRSFLRLLATDPGFEPDRVLTFSVTLPPTAYARASDVRSFYRDLLERLATLPDVTAAGAASDLPLAGREVRAFRAEGSPRDSSSAPVGSHSWVSGEYFDAFGIPLLRGRRFTEGDRRETAPVAIVSETLAQGLWPGQDPIGKRIRWTWDEAPWLTVVGVVGDVKDGPLQSEPRLHTYTPYAQEEDWVIEDAVVGQLRSLNFVVHAEEDLAALLPSVREVVRELDPGLAVANVQPMAEILRESVGPQRFSALLVGQFALTALFLAAIGIYGVMAYGVTQRYHEIGIRLAVGSQTRDVLRLVSLQGLKLAGVGIGLGLLCAAVATRLMRSLLFGVEATDPATFVITPLVLAAVALAACYFPARRATRVDPLIVLRKQ